MRKVKDYEIKKESIEDMCTAGRFNPCLEITYRDKDGIQTHKLKAGNDDELYVYREDDVTYVLSENPLLGYVGLEVFCSSGWIDSIFQSNYDRMDLQPLTKVKLLSGLICW